MPATTATVLFRICRSARLRAPRFVAGADFPRAIARAKTLLSDGRLVCEIMRQFLRGVIHKMFVTSVAKVVVLETWLVVVV